MKEKTLIVRSADGQWAAKTPKPGRSDALRKALEEKGYAVVKAVSSPSMATLEKWSDDGVCKALDGCRVEPDGTCPHGAPSWLLALRMI